MEVATKQDYKQTEMGLIPNDWEIKSIAEIAEIIGGGTPNTSVPKFWNGDIDWYTPTEIGSHKYTYNSIRKITTLGLKISSARILPIGAILLTTRAGIGDVSILMNEGCTNQGFQSLIAKQVISNEFLYYLISTMKNVLIQNASGSTFLEISPKRIKAICNPIPPIPEQEAIAIALKNTDDLIQSLEELIAKKKLIKQGAMQELLKPKEGWVTKKLGEVGNCFIGLTYKPEYVKSSGILVLRSSNIQNNMLKYDDNVFVDVDVSEKLLNRENDILICVRNGSRNLIGKCALIKGYAIGQTFGAFMSIYRSEYNIYIYHVFQSNIISTQIEAHLGATINQITNKSLNSFEIPFPTLQEQNRIANILNEMEMEIEILEEKLDKYKTIKQGMMQQLLSGKIRLI